MRPYQYKIYGLVIHSEFTLHGLVAEIPEGIPDVQIKPGKLNLAPYSLKKGFLVKKVTSQGFLYGIKGSATFLISNGSKVIVDPLTSDTKLWQMHLLGSVMGALLQQRGFLTLHGSAFLYNNKAHLVVGASGMGKSTIAMAMHQRGYKLLTDDICAIKVNSNEQPYLLSNGRHVKLWGDAIQRLNISKDNVSSVREGLAKHRVLIEEDNYQSTYTIGQIFALNITRQKGDSLAFTETGIMQKLQLLNLNVYRKQFLQDMDLEENAFHMLSKLANINSGIVLSRRNSQMDVRTVAEKIEDFLKA